MREDRHHEIHVSTPTGPVAPKVTAWRSFRVGITRVRRSFAGREWWDARYDQRNESGQANDLPRAEYQCVTNADRSCLLPEESRPLYCQMPGKGWKRCADDSGDGVCIRRERAAQFVALADEPKSVTEPHPSWCPKTRYYSIFTGPNLAVGDLTAEEAIEAMRDAGPDDAMMVFDGRGRCLLALVDARSAEKGLL